MQAILRQTARRVIWFMLAVLALIWGCGVRPERAQDPEQAMTPPATLASLHQPDMYIREMRVRRYGPRRTLSIVVANQGGNLGLLDTDELSDTYGEVIAHQRVTVTMLICANGWDQGEDDFDCDSPSHRIRHYGIPAPKANEAGGRTMDLNVYSAWQIHVMVEPYRSLSPEFVPVIEKDYPSLWNNQAVMKLIIDPSRDSWRGDGWYWPNNVDSLPF